MSVLSYIWQALTFALTVPAMLVPAMLTRSPDRPWVIGGHGGRAYMDNSAALHAHAVDAGQPVIWIAGNRRLADDLRAKGYEVRRRGSAAARWALLTAPAVIYSHGEDDVELYGILLRRVLGERIYLNHCMNHLKAGQHYTPAADSRRGPGRWMYNLLVTDFDHLLACTEAERANFELSFPHRKERIQLGGGAHVDGWMRMRESAHDGSILYFPTFREGNEAQLRLEDTIEELAASDQLTEWLRATSRRMYIVTHTNTRVRPLQVAEPFALAPPERLLELAARSALLISDYSGVTFDYFALNRPIMLFPFDLASYLTKRRLYVEYSELDFAMHATTPERLIELLTNESWLDDTRVAEGRDRWRTRLFAHDGPAHCADTFAAIRNIVAPG